jgi:hypothetical protein
MTDQKQPMTIDDPVAQETLKELMQLQDVRGHLCEKVVQLEQEKIRALAAIKRLEDQRQRVLDKILVNRGMSPNTVFEINGRTGKITIPKPVEADAESIEDLEAV